MKKYIFITIIIVISLIVSVYQFFYIKQSNYYKNLKNQIIKINDTSIKVEVQSTYSELASGLMYRLFLPEYNGMLFLLKSNQRHTFWMLNTFIPLDIIWINQNNIVVDISKNTKAMNLFNFLFIRDFLYRPKEPVNKALEVNAGFTDKNNIKIGDKVDMSNLDVFNK